jgi:hypothetical protein
MKANTVFLGPNSGGNENEKIDWKQREGNTCRRPPSRDSVEERAQMVSPGRAQRTSNWLHLGIETMVNKQYEEEGLNRKSWREMIGSGC